MTTYKAGDVVTLPITFREYEGGPYTNPPDPRFDVYGPTGTLLASDVVATLLISPGRYEGSWTVASGSVSGTYVMRFQATIDGVAVEQDCTFEVGTFVSSALVGPCSVWATTADLCTPCDDYDLDDALMDEYLISASEILYELSAQQFPGECETTVRPCTRRAYETVWHDIIPRRIMGNLFVGCGCTSNDSCGCGQLNSIDLGYPINEVTQVKVDGEILDDEFYRVDDYRYLVRLRDVDDSNPGWPCCQDLTLPDTEEDTFSVTFLYGLAPPTLGVRAAATLACELYMACNPEAFEGKCRLPRNVVQVVRNNIAVQMEPPSELLRRRSGEPMRFGIPEIDLFLQTYNPYGLHAPTVVLSPDLPEMGKRVNT